MRIQHQALAWCLTLGVPGHDYKRLQIFCERNSRQYLTNSDNLVAGPSLVTNYLMHVEKIFLVFLIGLRGEGLSHHDNLISNSRVRTRILSIWGRTTLMS